MMTHSDSESSLINQGPLLSSGSLDVTQILVHKGGIIVAGSDKIEDGYKRVLYIYNRRTLKSTALTTESNCSFG